MPGSYGRGWHELIPGILSVCIRQAGEDHVDALVGQAGEELEGVSAVQGNVGLRKRSPEVRSSRTGACDTLAL